MTKIVNIFRKFCKKMKRLKIILIINNSYKMSFYKVNIKFI